MLSISPPLLGAGKGHYYLKLAREDYYLEGGEPPGQWHGYGAKMLGLKGVVNPHEFSNLLQGFSPDGTASWAQNAGSPNRQCGWDLTFSMPKSVSVFWSQSRPKVRKKIEEVHAQAVRTALDYLEAEAGLTRRGKGGTHLERVPLVFAIFEHSTSRALDPQPHAHALLLNVALRKDGTTGTLYSKEIFRHKMAAGALYRAELASGLSGSLGLALEQNKDSFEIKGVPRSLCEEFSKRRRQVKERLASRGEKGAVAAKIATLDTRVKKSSIPRDKLFRTWLDTGKAHGWSTEQARALIGQVLPTPKRALRESVKQSLTNHHPENLVLTASRLAPSLGLSAKDVLLIVKEHMNSNEKHHKTGNKHPNAENHNKDTKAHRHERQHKNTRKTHPEKKEAQGHYKRKLAVEGPISLYVGHQHIFPSAPKWNPAKKWTLPYLTFQARKPPLERWGKLLAKETTFLGTLELRQKYLFAKAPKWSPLHKASAPAFRIMPKPKQRMRER